MSGNTAIEWTDRTWNPLTGCTKVSPGCDHCYAKTMHERFNGPGSFDTVTLHPERLRQPLSWRKPSMVFVNSMSDLFHQDVPDEYIADVFGVMAANRKHTFQLLTKRHGRMHSLLNSDRFRVAVHTAFWMNTAKGAPDLSWPLPNLWLGISAEDQQRYNLRWPALRETPAAVRMVSAEPLLDSLSLFANSTVDGYPAPDWVIVGGESGPGARPMHPAWALHLRDECASAGIAFLFKQAGTVLAKQWGAKGKGTDPAEWPFEFPRDYPQQVTA